jgi:hypothetical protein
MRPSYSLSLESSQARWRIAPFMYVSVANLAAIVLSPFEAIARRICTDLPGGPDVGATTTVASLLKVIRRGQLDFLIELPTTGDR